MHYFSYWKPKTAKFEKPGNDLDHSASNHYRIVKPGDVLWFVTVEKKHLYLLGNGIVDDILSDEEAVARFGEDIWEAEYHVALRSPYTKVKWTDITDIATLLRFESKDKPTLIADPAKWGNSLQSFRRLTPETIILLEHKLIGDTPNGINSDELRDSIEPILKYREQLRTFRIRDTAVTIRLKQLYEDKCQICDLGIEDNDQENYFCDVHHIWPHALGGPDIESNMLVLCPNHHRLFDLGITRFIDSNQIGVGQEVFRMRLKHEIDNVNIEYHNTKLILK